MKNYEYYTIHAVKGDFGEDCHEFKVRAKSHTQHDPYSTRLNGLSDGALKKIRQYKDDGYQVSAMVGGNSVAVKNY